MKTKTFLLLCLFSGIGLTQLSAQNGKNGNGAVTYLYTCDDFFQPVVNNDGVEIDYIVGTVTWHIVDFYKDGYNYYSIGHGKDVDIHSNYPPYETFTFSGSNAWEASSMTTTRHFNLKGSNGSHYIGQVLFDLSNYPLIKMSVEKLVCPGNDK
ncbi:MAG: hypothetical protein A2V50_07155 [Bacteroidetes bacterium RBG_19FT_COMBO_42_10]|nr:MAG: hypothetical protein A2V50_07155 [Bacteroidetes bacterium RBG_19FT_COMBO_42_10]